MLVFVAWIVLPLVGACAAARSADKASGGRRIGLTLLAVLLLLSAFCGLWVWRFGVNYEW